MIKAYPQLVAEISANHNGSYSRALRLIKLAKKNKADAVKLQTFDENSMTINSNKKNFIIKSGIWKGYNLWHLYKKAKTPIEWHKDLFDYSKKLKIKCFSTPFDIKALNFLEKLNCPIYKIASFEATDLEFIKEVALTKKPIIISTGLCSLREIDDAYNIAIKYGIGKITLLYCVSAYPAKKEDFNLENIAILKKRYNCNIGFSDHSTNNDIAKIAVAKGAVLFEKHIAEKNQKNGLDIKFSLKGNEIKKYKEDIIESYKIIGKKNFFRSASEKKNLFYRRSIFSIKNIAIGEKFTKENLKTLRPFIGISACEFPKIIGQKSKKKIKQFTVLKNNHFN